MFQRSQQRASRRDARTGACTPADRPARSAERAARATLRAQIAKLEHELSALLADRFPFVAAPARRAPRGAARPGPRLPGLGELERTRDRLAGRLQELRTRAARRTEHERRARELLERMRLEPGRYKYYRVPVRDLGQSGLRRLRSAAPARPDRHARRLVAAHALLRLSVTQGVALQRDPVSSALSIAASVRR